MSAWWCAKEQLLPITQCSKSFFPGLFGLLSWLDLRKPSMAETLFQFTLIVQYFSWFIYVYFISHHFSRFSFRRCFNLLSSKVLGLDRSFGSSQAPFSAKEVGRADNIVDLEVQNLRGSAWRRKIERWAHAIGHCLRKEVQASRVCHMSVTCKPLPQPLEISGITVKFQCVPVPVSKNLYQMSTVKPLWTKAYELERWDTAGASNLHEMKIHKDTHFLFCRAPRSLPFGKSTSQVAALKPRQQVPCPLVFTPTIHYRMFLAQSTLEKWWGCKRQLTIQAIRDCLTFW